MEELFNMIKGQQECIELLEKKTEIMAKMDNNLERRLRSIEENFVALTVIVQMLLNREIPEEEQDKFMKEAREEIDKELKKLYEAVEE